MVKNRIKKSVSFLGLALLVASSLTPVLSGPREESIKKTFSATKKEANAQKPLTEAEAVYAVSEAYGPKKRNLYEVFDEIIAKRAVPLAAAPAAVAPKAYVPTPEELEAGRKALQPIEPMVGPMPETEAEAFQRQLAEAKANLRTGNEAEFDDFMRNVEGFLPETEKAVFERQLAEAKANLRSGNEAAFDDSMRNIEGFLPETEKAAFERKLAETKANLRSANEAAFDDSMRNIEGFLPETEKALFERKLAETKANLRSGNEAAFDDSMRNIEGFLPETEKAAFERQLAEAKANLRSGNEAAFDDFMLNVEVSPKLQAAKKLTLEQEIAQAGGAMVYTRALWEQAKEMSKEMMTLQNEAQRSGKTDLRQRITNAMGDISHRINTMVVAKSNDNYSLLYVERDKKIHEDATRILNEIKAMFLAEPL